VKTPFEVRRELVVRWDREMPTWAQAQVGILDGATAWPVRVALGAPSEGEAIADIARTKAWVRSWQPWSGGGAVRTADRGWRSLGRQTVPTHLELASAHEVAQVTGRLRDWERLTGRLADLAGSWPVRPLDRRTITWLVAASDTDWGRVRAFLHWTTEHPTSGLLPRQIPVPGLDSKWFEQHRTVLTSLRRATSASADFGLRVVEREIAVQVPDWALAQSVGGMTTFSASAGQLARLAWRPDRVVLCENLQSALSFDDLPGSVVLSRQGYAVDVFGEIPWLRRVPVLYWGDLDTHGFAILNRLRSYLPHASSVLMDRGTLLEHRDLWVEEPTPTAAGLPLLSADEQGTYQELVRAEHGDRVRLEQERIGWAWVRTQIG